MRQEIARARELLMARRGTGSLWWIRRLSRDIRIFAGGGLAILRAIERVDYDVFRRRPSLGKLDYLPLGLAGAAGTA